MFESMLNIFTYFLFKNVLKYLAWEQTHIGFRFVRLGISVVTIYKQMGESKQRFSTYYTAPNIFW